MIISYITDMWTERTDPSILKLLGSRIKEFRQQAGLKQSDLAVSAGVGISTVAKLEKGESISLQLLVSVMRSLGLLENFEKLIPSPMLSPIQRRRMQTRRIIRVRGKNAK